MVGDHGALVAVRRVGKRIAPSLVAAMVLTGAAQGQTSIPEPTTVVGGVTVGGGDPEDTLDAAFIGSAPGGPPWWKVSKGETTVWILGLPAGRTFQSRTWNDRPLREALSGARLLITPYSPWRRVKLEFDPWRPLPDGLGARVAAAAVKVRKPLRNRKPTVSDAIATHLNFYQRNRLSDQAPPELLRLAVDKKVRVATPPARPAPAMASLDPASPEVVVCVEAMLGDIDSPTEPSRAAAMAWASGDVAGALSAPRGAEWACRVLWPDYWDRTVGFETEAIAMALEMPGKVVAAADIGQLVARDGVLSRLRARGFEVSGPMQPTGH
jgi:hypothetical protein